MGDFLDNQLLIAERIQNLCFAKKITVNKMLSDCGAGTRLVQNLKSGSFPSVDKFVKIADYFGCSLDYLLGRDDVTPILQEKSFSAEENTLVRNFRQLNEEGRFKLTDYADDLVSSGKYAKEKTISAG